MSHTDDMNETTSEESMLLLDLLYGELEGDAEEAATARVDSDEELAGELEELRGLRGLFAAMPDEEPPAAVSAQLLHAAAAAAPVAKKATETEGGFFAWFRNLFGPIMRYPGLAAAASLVLVAGIAGTLYVTGGGKAAQPDVDSRSEAPAATSQPSPTGSAGVVTGKDMDRAGDKNAEPSYTDDLKKEGAAQDPAPEEDEETAARPSRDKKSKPALRARTRGKKRPATSAPGFSSNQKSPPPPPPGAKPADRGPSVQGKSGGRIVVNPKTVPPAKKPRPVADEADKRKGDSTADNKPSAPKPEPKKDSKKAAEKVSQALSLHRQARLAAKKGDCAKVRSITLKVRKIDSRYYDTKYLSDPSLRACLRGKPAVKK